MTRILRVGFICVLAWARNAVAEPMDLSRLRWYCQHAIRTNETPYSDVLSGRGLALSADGNYLYLGHNSGTTMPGVMRVRNDRKAATTNAFAINTLIRLYGYMGKGIASDDQGRVYLAEGSGGSYTNSVWWPTGGTPVTNAVAPVAGINIFSPDLSNRLYTIAQTKCEGVATRREGGVLALYATDRTKKTLTRWELAESGVSITGATLSGLDGDGVITNSSASNLRGVDVDANGRIWMADISANKIWRCDSDGSGMTSVTATAAMDVRCVDGRAYVSTYVVTEDTGSIFVLDANTMALVATLARPSSNVTGVTQGTFSGLDVLPGRGGIYVHVENVSDPNPARLVAAPNWQNPVLHIEPRPAGALYQVKSRGNGREEWITKSRVGLFGVSVTGWRETVLWPGLPACPESARELGQPARARPGGLPPGVRRE